MNHFQLNHRFGNIESYLQPTEDQLMRNQDSSSKLVPMKFVKTNLYLAA